MDVSDLLAYEVFIFLKLDDISMKAFIDKKTLNKIISYLNSLSKEKLNEYIPDKSYICPVFLIDYWNNPSLFKVCFDNSVKLDLMCYTNKDRIQYAFRSKAINVRTTCENWLMMKYLPYLSSFINNKTMLLYSETLTYKQCQKLLDNNIDINRFDDNYGTIHPLFLLDHIELLDIKLYKINKCLHFLYEDDIYKNDKNIDKKKYLKILIDKLRNHDKIRNDRYIGCTIQNKELLIDIRRMVDNEVFNKLDVSKTLYELKNDLMEEKQQRYYVDNVRDLVSNIIRIKNYFL